MTMTEDRLSGRDRTAEERRNLSPLPRPRPWASRLRLLLVGLDATGLLAAWLIGLCLADASFGRSVLESMAWAAGITVVGVVVLNAFDLYLSRTTTVRAVELARVFKASVVTGAIAIVALRVARVDFRTREVVVAILLTFVFLLVFRSGYRAWIGSRRRLGRNVREVVVVGAGADAVELITLLDDHPDIGFRVVGVLGRRTDALRHGLIARWCGTPEQAPEVVAGRQANGVVIAVGSVDPSLVDVITRDLLGMGAHVHLSTGVRGIDHRRLKAVPLAYEPFLYLEPVSLSRAQMVAKRAFDVVVASTLLVLLAPVLGLVAWLVRRHDRGPVLFAQRRVGQDGRPIQVLKFRTMVVDAEARLAELQQQNERTGPLFKMEDDPRVTRIGRILRDSSLDELPQLINVVRGEMSLVGPRPAKPDEVAKFDERLQERMKVRPGITGLWQVEARDNPNFSAYRRLDLFYVDNWSLLLDVMITLGTVEQVIARMLRLAVGRRRRHAMASASAASPATSGAVAPAAEPA